MKANTLKFLRVNALPLTVALVLTPIILNNFDTDTTMTVNADYEPEFVAFDIEDYSEPIEVVSALDSVQVVVEEVNHTSEVGQEIKTEVVEVSAPKEMAEPEPIVIEQAPVVLEDDCNIPDGIGICNSDTITYMPYTAVTARNSNQYRLLNSEEAYTDETTGFRMVDGRICVAIGTGYCSTIGTKIDVYMKNGSVIPCILGDVKSDEHTDETNRYHTIDGSVLEVIVDYTYFNGVSQYPAEMDGKIQKIVIVEE